MLPTPASLSSHTRPPIKSTSRRQIVNPSPVPTDAASLLWMTNQNTITPHVWASRALRLYYPDVCVFDLDPPEDHERVLGCFLFLDVGEPGV